MAETKKMTPPYVAFRTLFGAIEQLQAHGTPPNKIDRTVFPSYSGAIVSQLISALRFLKLIDENDAPTPMLEALVSEKEDRKANIRKMIQAAYPDIMALDLARMPPSQLEAVLSGENYAVSGETKAKAKTFLLKAAEYAGIPVSPLLTKITRKPKGSGVKRSAGVKVNGNAQTVPETPPAPKPVEPPSAHNGSAITIQLKDGGSLTLSCAVNVLKLRGTDREFVFKIIDQIEEYEKGKTQLSSDDTKSE
jgi:hypothetical protein